MTLLQIHEPGETPLPHADAVAVGIDLGTTHSVIAVADRGNIEVLHDICGGVLVPSAVHYVNDGTVRVGKQAHADPGAIHSIKRLMGRGRTDVHALDTAFPHAIADSELLHVRTAQGDKTPVEISAEILKHLKKIAETTLGKEITHAVITVPAYFDDAARTATRDAARLAGLEVLRLVNEPTAAALAYGLDNEAEGIYAIYDLGGGTFDISILKLEKGVFQVLATGGDIALGGDDFDAALAEYLSHSPLEGESKSASEAPRDWVRGTKKLKDTPHASSSAFGLDSAAPPQGGSGSTRLIQARKIKEQLSETDAVEWEGHSITRADFERMIQPFIGRTLHICEQAVQDAGIAREEIQGVVLVGGSTRIPAIRQAVEAFFGQPPLTDVDPDQVVAVGAAIQAEGLTRGSDNLLLDVTPLSLGLETMGGLVEKIIHRNTPIPVSVTQEFTTYQDGQTAMLIHVLQGEREMVDQCRSLAKFTLKGIPPLPAGIARIAVSFTVDADGLLSVSAREETTGTEQRIEVKPSYGLPPEQIEQMLRESMVHAREDIAVRLLAEARMEAGRLVEEIKSALAGGSELLQKDELQAIETAIKKLNEALKGDDRDAIDYRRGRLEQAAQPFAERRMDRAIVHALKGSKIDELS